MFVHQSCHNGWGRPACPALHAGRPNSFVCLLRPISASMRRDKSLHQSPPSEHGPGFISVAEITAAAARNGIALNMDTIGPFFKITARNARSDEVLGVAQGLVKVWIDGCILHLDSIRMTKLSLEWERPIFGTALLLGALAIRHGFDCSCTKAELLAINDNDLYHSKLVRYYTRMGFNTVYRVTGDSMKDIPHMLIWGGVGTRMDANITQLLHKWTPALRKASAKPLHRE